MGSSASAGPTRAKSICARLPCVGPAKASPSRYAPLPKLGHRCASAAGRRRSRSFPGAYGIPMPLGTEVMIPDLLLIPLVGFDSRAYRLGYGGGGFDCFLRAPHI